MTERRWIRNSQMLALLLKYFAHAHIWIYRRTNGRWVLVCSGFLRHW